MSELSGTEAASSWCFCCCSLFPRSSAVGYAKELRPCSICSPLSNHIPLSTWGLFGHGGQVRRKILLLVMGSTRLRTRAAPSEACQRASRGMGQLGQCSRDLGQISQAAEPAAFVLVVDAERRKMIGESVYFDVWGPARSIGEGRAFFFS